jgi:hypothetical protein
MSAPSRLKRESFARKREGGSMSAPSRLKRESFARERESGSMSAHGHSEAFIPQRIARRVIQ